MQKRISHIAKSMIIGRLGYGFDMVDLRHGHRLFYLDLRFKSGFKIQDLRFKTQDSQGGGGLCFV